MRAWPFLPPWESPLAQGHQKALFSPTSPKPVSPCLLFCRGVTDRKPQITNESLKEFRFLGAEVASVS